jgi:CheY-like chemotaxis protein
MPHEDGYSLAEKVRAWTAPHGRPVPTLALSAYAGVHDAKMAELAGFQRHMAKPVLPTRLIEEVALMVGR